MLAVKCVVYTDRLNLANARRTLPLLFLFNRVLQADAPPTQGLTI